ncbi:MAG: ATP-dependent DNA helicase [Candidatus Lokiarchaeota archaeon]|nr:ATP-dependent DNA helicase [Candidatus Lokiarchaeota archaeon]
MIRPETLFPYNRFRDEQEGFIVRAYDALNEGNHVIAAAPNGFGKTISVLCATLPVALENELKIVYCCRTHTQNARVIMELNAIHEHLIRKKIVPGIDEIAENYSGVSLRGRNEMCFKDQIRETDLSPGDASAVCTQLRKDNKCKYYKKFQQLSASEIPASNILPRQALDSDDVLNACREKEICPYFFTYNFLETARVAVCNYNWFFNPNIHDRFMESIGVGIEDILLVIDEAHNLPSLSEEIYSLRMSKFTVTNARKELREYFTSSRDERVELAERLLIATEELFDAYESRLKLKDEMTIDGRALIESLRSSTRGSLEGAFKMLDDLGDEIQKQKLEAGRKSPRSACKAVAKFIEEWQYTMDKAAYHHCFSVERDRKYSSSFQFEAVCLDPGTVGIKKVMEHVYASISLSGTIVPEAYTAICRIPRPEILRMNSPFAKDHVKAIILDGVSTVNKSRTVEMYKRYLGKIIEMADATPKNSAVFCASYNVLKGIKEAGFEEAMRRVGKFPVIEKEGTSSSENDELIAQYKEYSRTSDGAVLLGVTGGRNSEGEDFPGDEMNAVMVIGVPYASPTDRVNAKIEYYNKEFGAEKGWSLAYEIPAIQKANQACGRTVRTLDDHAVIILADERFSRQKILGLLSPWILRNICQIKDVPGHLNMSVKNFFAGFSKGGCKE